MAKRGSVSDAKNNVGGLLEDVAALECVGLIKHGRLVAVVLPLRALAAALPADDVAEQGGKWGKMHMIPAENTRRARMVGIPSCFDEE
jgi:antitoxin (DNA-binding transcriptional repressor) of toxin-antitoxin stability system